MKKLFIATALLMAFGGAHAQSSVTSSSNGTSTGQNQTSTSSNNVQSGSTANASNQGVIGAIYNTPADTTATITYGGSQTVNQNQTLNGTQTQNVVQSGGTDSTIRQEFGTQKIKNTPSVSGPPLTASNDTCMGSASGSLNAPGFGLSVGKTYTDDNCVMLKNSRELWNMGMKAASMALMCMDKNNREALEMTGFECPQTARAAGRTTAN